MKYRPWGKLSAVLGLSAIKRWHYFGCLGTEERSLCAWIYLKASGDIASEKFAQIIDVDSEKYRIQNKVEFDRRRNEFFQAGGASSSISVFDLLAERFYISSFLDFVRKSPESVVLDITSFPKRYYFLLLKLLVRNPDVKNLIVTYTSPGFYADDQPLYEDMEPWGYLPGFGWIGEDEQKPESWVVSVGFLVESLRREISDNPPKKMKLLVPFPAPISVLRRSRRSVVELEEGFDKTDLIEKHRVDTLDMSMAFDRIVSLTDRPTKSVVFAPFGPKPTTAAMCLYALQREDTSSVLYPQPTIYHPKYSEGIKGNDPEKAINAYWVKHEGDFLYQI